MELTVTIITDIILFFFLDSFEIYNYFWTYSLVGLSMVRIGSGSEVNHHSFNRIITAKSVAFKGWS